MISKGEVIEEIKTYGLDLGEERVKAMVISDEWSDAMTMVVLLLQSPDDDWYQSSLDDEATRIRVHEKVVLLQENLRAESSKYQSPRSILMKEQVHVVIPEDSATFKSLWESTSRQGVVLEIFPGVADIPRGIKGIRDDELAAASREAPVGKLPEDMVLVVVSNGHTIQVPEQDVRVIAQKVGVS